MTRLAGLVRLAGLGLVISLLVACSPASVRPDQQLLAAQKAREQRLGELNSWVLHGRLAVSAHGDGGSGSLLWKRDGAQFDFLLRAPVTGRSFRLQRDARGVVLKGLDQGPVRGASATRLLARVLGWQVPVQQLKYWVRGMRAPGQPAQLRFRPDGLPAQLVQDGWTVQYKDWYGQQEPPLPRRIFAQRDDASVRLVIRKWSLSAQSAESN